MLLNEIETKRRTQNRSNTKEKIDIRRYCRAEDIDGSNKTPGEIDSQSKCDVFQANVKQKVGFTCEFRNSRLLSFRCGFHSYLFGSDDDFWQLYTGFSSKWTVYAMATSLRLINLLKQNRAIYSCSSKLLAQSVRLPHQLQESRNFGLSQNMLLLFSIDTRWECLIKVDISFLGSRVLASQSCLLGQGRCFSSASTEQASKPKADKHEFKAETRMLLDIVARSLYSENEVFVRELVSNASDALEKFRYTIQTAGEQQNQYEGVDRPLEIHLDTNKQASTLTIKDTGIGKRTLIIWSLEALIEHSNLSLTTVISRYDTGRVD